MAAEDAAALQHLPSHTTLSERVERLGGLVGQFGGVAVVDGDALERRQRSCARRLRRGCSSGGRLGVDSAQLLAQFGLRRRAEHHRSTQWRLVSRSRHRGRGEIGADGDSRATLAGQPSRHVLLEDGVEVGAPESEGAHPRAAHVPGRHLPVGQLRVDVEGRPVPIDVRVGLVEAEAGRDLLVVQRQRRLQQSSRPGRRLEVADVRLHRTQGNAAAGDVGRGEDVSDAADLDDITDPRRGAVCLDQRARLGRQTGVAPGALHRQSLADRVRRSDALAAAIAGPANAADHGIDLVTGPFGICQSLQHEQRRSLAHHESVGAGIERPGARGRECADLAELDERRCTHVAVDATCDGHIELAGHEAGDRRVERGHGRRAGGVDDEVRAVQVEQVGDPPGDAVAQLAGHRVLGQRGCHRVHPTVQLVGDGHSQVVGETGERGRIPEFASDLGEGDA